MIIFSNIKNTELLNKMFQYFKLHAIFKHYKYYGYISAKGFFAGAYISIGIIYGKYITIFLIGNSEVT